jgi:hypothetical protein
MSSNLYRAVRCEQGLLIRVTYTVIYADGPCKGMPARRMGGYPEPGETFIAACTVAAGSDTTELVTYMLTKRNWAGRWKAVVVPHEVGP